MAASTAPRPDRFFEVRFRLESKLGLTAVCAGYELREWRNKQLAGHLIKYLPEFALSYSERQRIGAHNAAEMLAQAAKSVYMSEKYRKRGEIGELLLHVICAEVFQAYPAITKYSYKDSANNTVKGFEKNGSSGRTRTYNPPEADSQSARGECKIERWIHCRPCPDLRARSRAIASASVIIGSSGRTRTYNPPVNSRSLNPGAHVHSMT